MITEQISDPSRLPSQPSSTSQQWLTLKEASDFLGVHYTTLRSWTDKGEIAVFRTPGGHRRFSLADLRRFLDERAHHALPPNTPALIEEAIVRTRQAIQQDAQSVVGWHYPLAKDAAETRRTRGRMLFSLAIAHVLKPTQRERTIQEAIGLGKEYGFEAATSGVSLAETGRAVQFFRGQLLQTLLSQDTITVQDADDLRIRRLIDQFLDEVLYAVLDGFESAQQQPALPV